MKSYLEALSILKALTNDKANETIQMRTHIYRHQPYVFYSFMGVGREDFYNIISEGYMKKYYEYEIIYDIHDTYDCYILPDGTFLNIPQYLNYSIWVSIPIKKS